ncbi:MAG: L,D-transpeptidase, partial [Chloroflexota bacterium]
MRRILAILLSLAFLLPILPIGVATAAEQAPLAVQGEILSYYNTHGGDAMFGAPLSGELTESGHTVQYFTRARLEVWPENPPAYRVMPGLLGVQMGKVQPAIAPADAPVNDPDRRYFPETGHVVAFAFKAFWEDNGGIDLLGYPTTELLVENGITVQYFQRARLEWHPRATGS